MGRLRHELPLQGDAPVFPGGVVGDTDGVIVASAAMADAIADETLEAPACAGFVMERVRAGARTTELHLQAPEVWRKNNGG